MQIPLKPVVLKSGVTAENKEIILVVNEYSEKMFRFKVSGNDADGDGLLDAQERLAETNPYAADSDGDGMLDNFEVFYGFDPLNGEASQSGNKGPEDDADGDGTTNLEEQNKGTVPVKWNEWYESSFNLGNEDFDESVPGKRLAEWYGIRGWSYQLKGETAQGSGVYENIGEPHVGENVAISVDVYSEPHASFKVEVLYYGVDWSLPGNIPYTKVRYGSEGQLYGSYSAANLTEGYVIPRDVNAKPFYAGSLPGYYEDDKIPLNGIIEIPDVKKADGPLPLAIIVHGRPEGDDLYIDSEKGFIYLCEQLASSGIITATISETFYNREDYENDARAVVLLEHVKQFKIWNETPGHPLEGMVDTNRIMLIGHSRGGEALEHVSYYNGLDGEDPWSGVNFDTNSNLGPYHFDLKALVAIAPSEGQLLEEGGSARVIPITENYLIMQGSLDGDLNAFQGYNTYDRAHPIDLANPLDSAAGSKVLVWIHGANHNYFNSEWDVVDYPITMSTNEQRSIASYFVTAFAYATLYDSDQAWRVFQDNRLANHFISDIQLTTQCQRATRRFINHYQEEAEPNTITLSPPHQGTNSAITDVSFSEVNFSSEVMTNFDNGNFTNNAVSFSWGSAGSSYTTSLDSPPVITGFNALTFRIAAKGSGPEFDEVDVRVSDVSGNSATFDLSRFASVWYPDESRGPRYTAVVMQTIRIPLADIVDMNNNFNINSIKKIELLFADPGVVTGHVYFDDLQLTE